jgi:hypothetical protein
MKKSALFNGLGIILATFGALGLVGSLMPIINPGLGGRGPTQLSTGNYIGVAVSLLILGLSWHFNKKGVVVKSTVPVAAAKAGKLIGVVIGLQFICLNLGMPLCCQDKWVMLLGSQYFGIDVVLVLWLLVIPYERNRPAPQVHWWARMIIGLSPLLSFLLSIPIFDRMTP